MLCTWLIRVSIARDRFLTCFECSMVLICVGLLGVCVCKSLGLFFKLSETVRFACRLELNELNHAHTVHARQTTDVDVLFWKVTWLFSKLCSESETHQASPQANWEWAILSGAIRTLIASCISVSKSNQQKNLNASSANWQKSEQKRRKSQIQFGKALLQDQVSFHCVNLR